MADEKESFYDDLAAEYDDLTGLAGRLAKARAFIAALKDRYRIASALDVACGTGLYAIELARSGIQAVGSDLSEPMLQQAARNAKETGVSLDWVPAPMQELPAKISRQFDAVLCMGNSIPHLLEDVALDAAIGGFVKLLAPGGIVALQLLNYAGILASRERIVGINRAGDREYVRFYDFLDGLVRFNILEITWRGDRAEHRLHSTTLRPYSAYALRACLFRHGCGKIELFGGLDFAPFYPKASDTVMLVGRKI